MKIPPQVYRWWMRAVDRPNALQQHQMDCNESRCQPWTDKERAAVERFRRQRDARPAHRTATHDDEGTGR